MRYHDFHLKEYTVSNHGAIVTLCLIKTEGSAPEAKQKVESHIEFSDVETYNFIHSGGAILTDILEVSLEQMINEVYPKLAEWSIQIGPPTWYWKETAAEYLNSLQERGCRAWWIYSDRRF